MLFQHVGRNTEIDGKRIPNDDNTYIEDDRELDKLFLGKFKRVKNPKGATVINLNDIEGKPTRVGQTRGVIDGGPSQPTAPNQSLDQRAANSGNKPLRDPGTVGKGGFEGSGPAGGGTQGTRQSPDVDEETADRHAEAAEDSRTAARKVLTGKEEKASKKAKPKAEGEHPGWEDVSADFERAKKADLAVVKYDDGSFQVFDADDVNNDDAEPLNKTALKTKKSVDAFLDKYKHG